MLGTAKAKTVAPPSPLPEGVTFHVMPGKYQGVRVAPPVSQSRQPAASSPPPPAPSAPPLVSKMGGKLWILWGIVALVVLVGGGIVVMLFLPSGTPQQEKAAETPVVATPPPEETLPQPAPEPPPVLETPVTPEPQPVEEPAVILASVDTDRDGLTDVEEVLYTTNPTLADMDNDGYFDGQEVQNLYNPTGNAPIRLADSPLVASYTNPVFRYTLLYPASWTVRPLDQQNPREVLFTAATGEFIQVLVDENPEGLSAEEWYVRQFPTIRPESIERVFMENLHGVWTKDKSTIYLTKVQGTPGNKPLYGITYNYGERTEVNFRTTLSMMVKSFRVE